MAPLFAERGIAAAFQCSFQLTAMEDGKLKLYLYAAETFVVAARRKGLTEAEFKKLVRAMKRADENCCAKQASNVEHRTQFFDTAFESVLGHRPVRQPLPAAVTSLEAAASNAAKAGRSTHAGPHEHSPPSPASKPPTKRPSVNPRRGLAELLPSSLDCEREFVGSSKLSCGSHNVWLQCNDDRCEH